MQGWSGDERRSAGSRRAQPASFCFLWPPTVLLTSPSPSTPGREEHLPWEVAPQSLRLPKI